MRRILISLLLIGAIIRTSSALLGDTKPAESRVQPTEVRYYAEHVYRALATISEQYVRPISTRRLTAAAIQGLYDAAARPVPANCRFRSNTALQHDAHEAIAKISAGLTVLAAPTLGKPQTGFFHLASPMQPDSMEVIAALERERQALGNVESLRGDEAVRVSIRAMVRLLDVHSVYLTGEEHRQQRQEGPQSGTGIILEERVAGADSRPPLQPLVVRSVVLGSPGQQVDVRPGDEIVEINNEATSGLTSFQALRKLNPPPGTELTLTIRRADEKQTRKVTVASSHFQEESVLGAARLAERGWDFFVDAQQKIGLIRLVALNHGASAELRAALLALQQGGVRGLVLDLRDCPGGYLNEAVSIADLFIDEGMLAHTEKREGLDQAFMANREGGIEQLPMVVLIGPETAGGGELIAAALQDHRRGVMIGQRTRGKASVQELFAFGNEHSIKLTKAIFVRPSGKNLHRFPDSKRWDEWGCHPDNRFEVRISPMLRRQVRYWRLQHDLRPPNSRESLPLDDLESDPVFFEGISQLRKMIRGREKS